MVTPLPHGNLRVKKVKRRGWSRRSCYGRAVCFLPCLFLALFFTYVNVLLHASLSALEEASRHQYPVEKYNTNNDLSWKEKNVTRLWLDLIVDLQYPGKDNAVSSLSKEWLPTQVRKDPLDPFQIEMGVVHPTRWTAHDYVLFRNDTRELPIPQSYEVMHAHWPPHPQRAPGVEDHFVPVEEGGKLVQGAWPDRLTSMTFLTILKNGHTHMMNTIGDLRQRLEGCKSDLMKHNEDKRLAKARNWKLMPHVRGKPQHQLQNKNSPWEEISHVKKIPQGNAHRALSEFPKPYQRQIKNYTAHRLANWHEFLLPLTD